MEKDLQAGRGDQGQGEFLPAFSAPAACTDLGCGWLLVLQTSPQPTAADGVCPEGWRPPRSRWTDGSKPAKHRVVGPCVPVQPQGVRAGGSSTLPVHHCHARRWQDPGGKAPLRAQGAGVHPGGPSYLFKLLAKERQSMARRRRCFMSAARQQCWAWLGSACTGSSAALFLYQWVHPHRCTSARDNTLSMSTQGSGSRNESLAMPQARQSERTGVKFAFVGEWLVAAEQGGARGPAGRWAVAAAFGASEGPAAGAEWDVRPGTSPLCTGNCMDQLSRWKPPQMCFPLPLPPQPPPGTCPWPWGAPQPDSRREGAGKGCVHSTGQLLNKL